MVPSITHITSSCGKDKAIFHLISGTSLQAFLLAGTVLYTILLIRILIITDTYTSHHLKIQKGHLSTHTTTLIIFGSSKALFIS